MQIINKHSLTVVEVTTRERREEYSGENWIELQSYIAALRAERDELRTNIEAALYALETNRGDLSINQRQALDNLRAVLAKYEVTK